MNFHRLFFLFSLSIPHFLIFIVFIKPLGGENLIYPLILQDFEIITTGSGVVESGEEKIISSPPRFNGRIASLVEEGKFVQKGDLLITLETSDLKWEIESLTRKAEIQEANISLKTLEEEEEVAKKNRHLEELKSSLQMGNKKLDSLKAPPPFEEVLQKKLLMESLQAEIAYQKGQEKAQKSMLQKGFLSQFEFQKWESSLEKNTLNLKEQDLNLNLLNQPNNLLEIEKFQTELKQKVFEKSSLEEELESSQKLKEVTLEKVTLQKERLEKQMERKKGELEMTDILSPSSGLVEYLKGWRGKPAPGMQIWAGLRLLKVVDPNIIKIKGKISEAKIQNIQPDASVKITFNTLPGEVVEGKITRIGKLAQLEFKKEPEGPKYFDLEIEVVGKLSKIPPISSTCSFVIQGKKFEKVYLIPLDFVSLSEPKEGDKSTSQLKMEIQAGQSISLEMDKVLHKEDNYFIVSGEGLKNAQYILIKKIP